MLTSHGGRETKWGVKLVRTAQSTKLGKWPINWAIHRVDAFWPKLPFSAVFSPMSMPTHQAAFGRANSFQVWQYQWQRFWLFCPKRERRNSIKILCCTGKEEGTEFGAKLSTVDECLEEHLQQNSAKKTAMKTMELLSAYTRRMGFDFISVQKLGKQSKAK